MSHCPGCTGDHLPNLPDFDDIPCKDLEAENIMTRRVNAELREQIQGLFTETEELRRCLNNEITAHDEMRHLYNNRAEAWKKTAELATAHIGTTDRNLQKQIRNALQDALKIEGGIRPDSKPLGGCHICGAHDGELCDGGLHG